MPTPNIMINEGDDDDDDDGSDVPVPKRPRPPPLISLSNLSLRNSHDSDTSGSDSDSSSTDQEDMMTAEEEAAARRYLSGGNQQDTRRMSSLDVYLAQPKASAESMIINRRVSLRSEEEEIAKLNATSDETQEQVRKEKLQQEREAVKREREAKAQMKRAGPAQSPSPTPRRTAFHKKGFGGLSKERRKKLKEIIMRKAREELKAERLKELHAKEDHLKAVLPPYSVDDLNESQLQDLLRKWHSQAKELESQRMELEDRLRKQDIEIQQLTRKLINTKGKYPMPILRKVNKKQNMLARLERLRAINAMRSVKSNCVLKSVAKSDGIGNPDLKNGDHETE